MAATETGKCWLHNTYEGTEEYDYEIPERKKKPWRITPSRKDWLLELRKKRRIKKREAEREKVLKQQEKDAAVRAHLWATAKISLTEEIRALSAKVERLSVRLAVIEELGTVETISDLKGIVRDASNCDC